jgi:hypothetical protein
VDREYDPLAIRELGVDAGFRRPTQPQASRVEIESPALQVMTDLARISPATIRLQAPLAGANQFMITRGVRLLLVVDDSETVVGVSATDILGNDRWSSPPGAACAATSGCRRRGRRRSRCRSWRSRAGAHASATCWSDCAARGASTLVVSFDRVPPARHRAAGEAHHGAWHLSIARSPPARHRGADWRRGRPHLLRDRIRH